MHNQNSFVTLTYNNQNLPDNRSVSKKEMQNFMKRLRKQIYPKKVRFYGCGEYGDRFRRPHYHILLFGHDFADKVLHKHGAKRARTDGVQDIRESTLYRSKSLEKIWQKGFSTIGNVTFESAGYVARYCTKKITGKNADAYYKHFEPEFALMSRRPGIGHTWIRKYFRDVYPKDFFTLKGEKYQPPRYYDNFFKRLCADTAIINDCKIENEVLWQEFEELKERRKEKAGDWESSKRLHEKWKHKKLITKPLVRKMEKGLE
jgi:hypothetical protein